MLRHTRSCTFWFDRGQLPLGILVTIIAKINCKPENVHIDTESAAEPTAYSSYPLSAFSGRKRGVDGKEGKGE